MNLQENIFRIKQMMGILNEQEKKAPPCYYRDWQNGDGITKPKVTITKSDKTGVTVVYEGPETGFCIARAVGSIDDTIHQLENVANDETSSKLKELYNNGIYVKPNLSEIKMTKKDNYHDIDIPFIPTTEDKAITSFARRGSWGSPNNAKAQFKTKLDEIYGDTRFGLIEKTDNPIIARGGEKGNIIEYFLAFRDLQAFPIKSKPQPITPNPVIPNTQTQPTKGTQTATTGGETPTATVQTTGGETPPNQQPATMEFKYPSIENPFTPKNGDPWMYAYDGTKLIVKNPKGSNTPFNLKDPDYFKNYLGSKLKTQEQLDKAIASIKNAYGKELGL